MKGKKLEAFSESREEEISHGDDYHINHDMDLLDDIDWDAGPYGEFKHTEKPKDQFHTHWIEDTGDRISRMLRMGYTIDKQYVRSYVSDDQEPREEIVKVSRPTGAGKDLTTIRMSIPIELFNRRQEKKLERHKERMNEIQKGSTANPVKEYDFKISDRPF